MATRILDCTLRDGGYINNWLFGRDHVKKILNNLLESRVEIIEFGYLQEDPYNKDSTLFCCVEEVELLLNELTFPLEHKVEFYGMLNYGHYDVSALPPASEKLRSVHGIRLAFHKKDLYDIYDTVRILLEKNYKVCIQPMITMAYSDEEINYLLRICNELNVTSVYIVDSFGNLTTEILEKFNVLYSEYLQDNISIGLHLHDNMQTSMANAMHFVKLNNEREIIIDASISGIGRGAGNLNSEIILNYLNNKQEKSYIILPLLELIDEYFELLMKEIGWGYSMAFFLSAVNNCHPNYASYYVNKKKLSVKSIKDLLEAIPLEKSQSFDIEYAQQNLKRYIESKKYFGKSFDYNIINNKKILLLGSGPTLTDYKVVIEDFIAANDPVVISLNFVPDSIDVNYAFFSNEKRYGEFQNDTKLNHNNLISSSNIKIDFPHMTLDIHALSQGVVESNNIALMFLNLCVKHQCSEAYLAGIDGYDINKIDNYAYKEYSQLVNKQELEDRNIHLQESFDILKKHIKLTWLTPSKFENKINTRIVDEEV